MTTRRWCVAVTLAGLLAMVAVGGYGYRFVREAARDTAPVPPPSPLPADIAEQVHSFCGAACHAYPPPDSFPRRYWRAEVQRGFKFYDDSGLSLRPPPVESVVRYYEERAPEELAAPEIKPASRPSALRFERISYPGPAIPERFAIADVNLVRLSASGPLDILASEMRAGLVMHLRPADPSPAWKVLARGGHPARTSVIDLDGDGLRDILVADLGNFGPTDRRCGRVVWLRARADGSFSPITLLEGVGRVADVQAADFRGVGRLDLVVAAFGWQSTGDLLYLENQTTDWEKPQFVSRVLDERHGAIHVPVTDLNGDGKPDFVALFAQEHETVVAFQNEGGGAFRKETLYTAPHPGYGSSGIQLVDLDGDRRLDVLYTNGDTLDEPYLFKPYHGVRWLRNRGGLRFEARLLTPMPGVHRAVAGDLLGRGRQDVVAVSFLPHDKFPERKARKADAVVLLEQVEAGRFERHALATVDCDHTTCAVGDLYGTGRLDLVVGHFSSPSTDFPVTIWKNHGAGKD